MTAPFGTFVTIVIHTPLWVWPLYALLILLGLQRARDSVVPWWRIIILPLVVIVLVILGVVGAGLSTLPAMLLGLAIGGVSGWWLEPRDAARRMAGGRLWLRGEWWTLVQIVLVLIVRYTTNVVAAMDPVLGANPVWHLGTVLISASLSGLFLGRTAARLQAFAPVPNRA